MPMFDGYEAWISVVPSGLVLVMSAILLRTVAQRLGTEPGEASRGGSDALPGRVKALRAKLAKADGADRAGDSAKSPTRPKQGAKTSPLSKPSRHDVEAVGLAQKIRNFAGALANWSDIVSDPRYTSEIDGSRAMLQQLEHKVLEDSARTPKAREDYGIAARDLMRILVSQTDMDFSSKSSVKTKLDACLRKMCVASGMELIEPREGDIYDKQLHKQISEAAESARREVSQGRPTVSHVFVRGLALSGDHAVDEVVLQAQVEVRY